MEIKARLNNLRIAPRKVRLVADLIRQKKAVDAQSLLSFTINKPAVSLLKLLNSALASAKHNFQLDQENLFVSKIMVDEGPKLKRWHPMSRGRAYPIEKRTSHIVLILSEITPKAEKEIKKEDKKKKKVKSKKRPTRRKKLTIV